MTCLHNHDQILEFLRKIFLKGFQIYQNYLCALICYTSADDFRRRKGRVCRMLPFPLVLPDVGLSQINREKFRACAHRNYELAS